MKIALFHYHLRGGGVTEMIVFSARALLSLRSDITELRLVTGEEADTEAVMERIREGLQRDAADRLRLDVLSELAYAEEAGAEGAAAEGAAAEIKRLSERLEARYDEDTLWWIHNYHLGKNPVFTAALMKAARGGRRNMLFHIHDFPECGRRENRERLDKVLDGPPYPSGPHIRYAVINERDRRILADAGLGDAVSLLSNPVPQPPRGEGGGSALRAALAERCGKENPGFMPDAPILLYPVRAIRRKNVLEAALLARVLDEPANLIVTLGGESVQEKGYSSAVEAAFRDGSIPGVWCPESTGDARLGYAELASGCDAVISTSVQEGFGYLFLNAIHWRKPLLARYLDILDGLLDIFGNYPRRFWADFRVPAEADLKERTITAYTEKIESQSAQIPAKSLKSLLSSVKKIAAGGGIDISFLSVPDQLEALKRAAKDAEWLEQTRALNRELLDSAALTLQARSVPVPERLFTRFGDNAFARTFTDIVSGFGTKLPSASAAKVREAVDKAFARIDYFRLLYDY